MKIRWNKRKRWGVDQQYCSTTLIFFCPSVNVYILLMQLYWIILVLPTQSYMLKYIVQKTRNINSKIIISMHDCPTNLKSQRDMSICSSESVIPELCSFLLSYKKFIQTKCFLMCTLTWHGLWLRLCKKEQSEVKLLSSWIQCEI